MEVNFILLDKMSTQEKILHFGKQEFLKHGFQGAYLRDIAKLAGVTTGAIYGYYADKNAIFEAIVDPALSTMIDMITGVKTDFIEDINERQIVFNTEDNIRRVKMFVDYIYLHYDVFKLLLACSQGTSRANFIDTLVELETKNTLEYIDEVKKYKEAESCPDEQVVHSLSSAYFCAVFEVVLHDLSKEEAIANIETIARFFNVGWDHVLRFI